MIKKKTIPMDLETLEAVKFIFELQSDNSARCNGYRSLLKLLDEVKQKDIFSKSRSDLCKKEEIWKDCVTWNYNQRCLKSCGFHGFKLNKK